MQLREAGPLQCDWLAGAEELYTRDKHDILARRMMLLKTIPLTIIPAVTRDHHS